MKVKKFDQINVIPFIDIMLVLLVIVLTTATFIAQGVIPVDLPEASSQKSEVKQDDLLITIDSDGVIYFDKEEIAKKQLQVELAQIDSTTAVVINSDRASRFEHFVFVLDALKENEFTNVGILSEDE